MLGARPCTPYPNGTRTRLWSRPDLSGWPFNYLSHPTCPPSDSPKEQLPETAKDSGSPAERDARSYAPLTGPAAAAVSVLHPTMNPQCWRVKPPLPPTASPGLYAPNAIKPE